jgi:hypothetical protein
LIDPDTYAVSADGMILTKNSSNNSTIKTLFHKGKYKKYVRQAWMLNIVTATLGRGAVAAPSKNEVGQIINVSLVKRWGKYIRFLKILTPSKNFPTPHPPPKKWKSNFFPSYAYCMLSSVCCLL